jgi:hypothetical protein
MQNSDCKLYILFMTKPSLLKRFLVIAIVLKVLATKVFWRFSTKPFVLLLLALSSLVFAQKDFSIYPLTLPLEFGTQFGPLFDQEGYNLEFSPAPMFGNSPTFSMQYVSPNKDVIYSMKFLEPDPSKKYSIYTPETPESTVEVIPNP